MVRLPVLARERRDGLQWDRAEGTYSPLLAGRRRWIRQDAPGVGPFFSLPATPYKKPSKPETLSREIKPSFSCAELIENDEKKSRLFFGLFIYSFWGRTACHADVDELSPSRP